MIRAIISAIVGYLAMAVFVFVGTIALWHLMGTDLVFAGESTRVSVFWSLAMLLCGLVGAIIGGCIAAKAAGIHGRTAVKILLGTLIVLGIVNFVAQWNVQPKQLPEGTNVHDLTFFEAGAYVSSPTWYNAALVVVGACGIWFGGKKCGSATSVIADSTERPAV